MSMSSVWSDSLLTIYPSSKLAPSFNSNIENISPELIISSQAPANQKKPLAAQNKLPKNTNHSIRAGDWVCLLCNNLNFSFRNECNRCQKQTKKQNYIQNLLMLSEEPQIQQPVHNAKVQRKPLADVTNIYNNDLLESNVNEDIKKEFYMDKWQKHGFENVLLLTPPKAFNNGDAAFKNHQYNINPFNLKNILQFNSPNSETNKKIIKPYNSPQQIPSISPILKSDLFRGNSKGEEICTRNLSHFLYDKIHEDSHEDELGYSNEENREEPIEMIFSKLMEDDSFSKKNIHNMNNGCLSTNENDQNNLLNSLIGFMNNPSYLNLNNNEQRDSKGKKKNKKATNENDRKSDWYCLNCNNLNYSFRVICNRCQTLKISPL